MALARVVVHVLARVLPHMLARVLLHVLARVIIYVHDYYLKTCGLDGQKDEIHSFPTMYIMGGVSSGGNGSKQ